MGTPGIPHLRSARVPRSVIPMIEAGKRNHFNDQCASNSRPLTNQQSSDDDWRDESDRDSINRSNILVCGGTVKSTVGWFDVLVCAGPVLPPDTSSTEDLPDYWSFRGIPRVLS